MSHEQKKLHKDDNPLTTLIRGNSWKLIICLWILIQWWRKELKLKIQSNFASKDTFFQHDIYIYATECWLSRKGTHVNIRWGQEKIYLKNNFFRWLIMPNKKSRFCQHNLQNQMIIVPSARLSGFLRTVLSSKWFHCQEIDFLLPSLEDSWSCITRHVLE